MFFVLTSSANAVDNNLSDDASKYSDTSINNSNNLNYTNVSHDSLDVSINNDLKVNNSSKVVNDSVDYNYLGSTFLKNLNSKDIKFESPIISETLNNKSTINSIIVGGDAGFRTGAESTYLVKLIDEFGRDIPNQNITITIGYKTYNLLTDKNGFANLSGLVFNTGSYAVNVTYAGGVYGNTTYKGSNINATIVVTQQIVGIDLTITPDNPKLGDTVNIDIGVDNH